MLKPDNGGTPKPFLNQPPSGGCVLKQNRDLQIDDASHQPPSGGCVLKQFLKNKGRLNFSQPPSGGCVLKPPNDEIELVFY